MEPLGYYKEQLTSEGFIVVEDVFNTAQIDAILAIIFKADSSKSTFRRTNDLFAIRQFFKEVPATFNLVFTDNLKSIITNVFGPGYFVVKAIYFDKPAQSNWFVPYHQDLTISVDKKLDVDGYSLWTIKHN